MKRFLLAATVLAATIVSAPVSASDIGVSVSIGEPGFYGRLDIGGFPAPRLLSPQPVMIERGYRGGQPIYLRVPPGHAKHWRKHCHEYNACDERVYFVRDDWYNREYAPRYQERHGGYREERRQEYREERRDKHRSDEGGGRGRDRGEGGGHGHGHGRD